MERKAKEKYERPLMTKEKGMNFPMRILVAGRQVVCKQCSSCHSCRP